jgi:hypothetical protein
MLKCCSIAAVALTTLALAACSHGSTTFTATSTLAQHDAGMKVTLKLNDFDSKNNSGGDGTLTIVKESGRQNSTPEGTYSVKWKWNTDGDRFFVSIPDARAGLELRPTPLDMNQTRSASVFWCLACERDQIGVGDLVWVPGVFVKNS